MREPIKSAAGVLAILLVVAATAGAQGAAASGDGSRQASSAGPLVIEPVGSGFVFTPEVRFTTVNHSNATFVGGRAGWLYDDSLFLGFGWSWMTNAKDRQKMNYGGVIAGWSVPVNDSLRLGVRGLFGFGQATLNATVPFVYPIYVDPYCGPCRTTQTVRFDVNFLVMEPQATLVYKATKKVSFDVAGGYRLTAHDHGSRSELEGAFGTVGVRFGPF